MLKDNIKRLFLYYTNALSYKNKEVHAYFKRAENKKQWDKYFDDKSDIVYDHPDGFKLTLNRNDRLAEYILFHDFEKSEIDFFKRYLVKGDIVLDIGANVGLHSIVAAKLIGKEGHVYAFEPVPDTCIKLQHNIGLNKINNITVTNKGLSDKNTVLQINVSLNYAAWNTMVDVSRLAHTSNIFDHYMDVQVIRLDDWLNENNISKEQIALIKLDVEGWEKFVLNGASGFLREQSPVLMIEFDENNAWAAGYLCHDLYDNLSDRGYKLYALNNGKLQSEPKRLHYPSQNLFAVKDDSSFYKRLSLNAIL